MWYDPKDGWRTLIGRESLESTDIRDLTDLERRGRKHRIDHTRNRVGRRMYLRGGTSPLSTLTCGRVNDAVAKRPLFC